jgi:hypothetical protein
MTDINKTKKMIRELVATLGVDAVMSLANPNRISKRHRSSGVDEGGYYAGFAPHYSAEKGEMAERNIDAALKGSNITGYATDNSSGDLARREIQSGAFKHHQTINGESFFSPGSSQPALRDRWQRLNKQALEHEKSKPAAKPVFDPGTDPL